VFGASSLSDGSNEKNVLRLTVARRRRQWFDGLWTQAAINLGLHRFGHE